MQKPKTNSEPVAANDGSSDDLGNGQLLMGEAAHYLYAKYGIRLTGDGLKRHIDSGRIPATRTARQVRIVTPRALDIFAAERQARGAA